MIGTLRHTHKAILSVQTRAFSLWYYKAKVPNHAHDTIAEYKAKKHNQNELPTKPLKTSMEWSAEVPTIEVDGNTAVCDGDTAAFLGHPREFIQLNLSTPGVPSVCKYCNLRFIKKIKH